MSKTNSLRTAMRDLIYRGGTYTAPAEWWLSVYSNNPGPDLGAATPLLARVQVNGWQNDGINAVTNSGVIPITNSTGSTITISHFSIHDASSGGRTLHFGAFSPTFIVNNNDTFNIQPGSIRISFL